MGPSYLSVSIGDSGLSGIGTALNLSAGYVLESDLMILASFTGLTVSSPDGKGAISGSLEGASINLSQLAAGVAYHVAPTLRLQGAIAFAQFNGDGVGFEGEGEGGFGLALGASYAWWFAESFGLATGLDILYGRVDPASGFGVGLTVGFAFN